MVSVDCVVFEERVVVVFDHKAEKVNWEMGREARFGPRMSAK
jgi:hypothetical protein